MIDTNFSPWPKITDEEIQAVSNVLVSNKLNYWTGNEAREFEKEFANYVGSNYAIAMSNGTTALETALKIYDLNKDDEIIVTPRSYLASATSIINTGAIPVFADVNRDSQNIDIDTIKSVYTKKTKGIICVHLAGWPCDMTPIMEFAKSNDLFVIEDCSQAHGAKYKGASVGSIGDIGCWSFCQDKIMTTGGEGGMITTNKKKLWSKMWSQKDHGKSWNAIYERKHLPGFKWLHETFGSNYRMTEMQAAIGRIQLKRLPKWNKARRFNAQKILNSVKTLPGIRVPELKCVTCDESCNNEPSCLHAFYKCYFFVKGGKKVRDNLMHEINKKNVPCYTGACPEIYLEKAFDGHSSRPKKRLLVAKELGETSLMFLCHPTLTKTEIEFTCDVIRSEILKIKP